jgi:ribosomal-protein-alanine N-acetyltransferase
MHRKRAVSRKNFESFLNKSERGEQDSVIYPETVPDFAEQTTARLSLRAMSVDDTDDLYPILSDAAGWWYEPEHRHTSIETTHAFASRAAGAWLASGLSYWTVRRLETDAVIGLGGAQRHRSGSWNLSYRIATAEQGNGYATELALAGIAAANEVDPRSAVIAWILDHNIPSRRVAERVGLLNYGERIDANDGTLRLAYADRPI